jgi:hypothetical protein
MRRRERERERERETENQVVGCYRERLKQE